MKEKGKGTVMGLSCKCSSCPRLFLMVGRSATVSGGGGRRHRRWFQGDRVAVGFGVGDGERAQEEMMKNS